MLQFDFLELVEPLVGAKRNIGETESDSVDVVVTIHSPNEEAVSASPHHRLEEWGSCAGTVEDLGTPEQFVS